MNTFSLFVNVENPRRRNLAQANRTLATFHNGYVTVSAECRCAGDRPRLDRMRAALQKMNTFSRMGGGAAS
jgi:hypothetical protein